MSSSAAARAALASVKSLRRRRIGHIAPNHYPHLNRDKWGLPKNNNRANHKASASLVQGMGGRRPPPRASLVLGHGAPPRRGGAGVATAASASNGRARFEGNPCAAAGMNGLNGNHRGHSVPASTAYVTDHPVKNDGGDDPAAPGVNGSIGNNDDKDNEKREFESDLVVVLDMDECIIHSQFLSDHTRNHEHGGDKYRQIEDRPALESGPFQYDEEAESIVGTSCESFRISLPDGDLVHVNKRPNLDIFLREITSKFETHIFTAAMEVYAGPLLDTLDPTQSMIQGRFYRESCRFDPDFGVYVKDLGSLMRTRKRNLQLFGRPGNGPNGSTDDDAEPMETIYEEGEVSGEEGHGDSDGNDLELHERRVVLVDNNPLSFLDNPSNGILVSNFYDDPKDDTLEAVMELLHELDENDDVRPVLDERFGLKDALREFARSGSGW